MWVPKMIRKSIIADDIVKTLYASFDRENLSTEESILQFEQLIKQYSKDLSVEREDFFSIEIKMDIHYLL